MVSRHRVWSVSIAALVIAVAAVASAGDNQKEFEKRWTGRHVVVKRPLYSLVYNESGLGGSINAGLRSGLTVVTPSAGIYFQFDGRHKVDDIVAHDVQQIAKSVQIAYRKEKLLGEGWTQKIDPVMLTFYDSGVALKVSTARVERDSVRLTLVLASGEDDDVATSLTVKWPAPLSKSFSERGNIEELIQQFLTVRE
jgi:RNase P/RNase MRP subunit POP5